MIMFRGYFTPDLDNIELFADRPSAESFCSDHGIVNYRIIEKNLLKLKKTPSYAKKP